MCGITQQSGIEKVIYLPNVCIYINITKYIKRKYSNFHPFLWSVKHGNYPLVGVDLLNIHRKSFYFISPDQSSHSTH